MSFSMSAGTYEILKYVSYACGVMLIVLIFVMRGQVSSERNIARNVIQDVFLSWCCGPCAICQAAQEYSGPNGDQFFTV